MSKIVKKADHEDNDNVINQSSETVLIADKFDEFIDNGDKEIALDTTTRLSAAVPVSPPVAIPIKTPIISPAKKRDISIGSKVHGFPQQLTPTRIPDDEQPLKEVHIPIVMNKSRSSTISKRRSLIQPIAMPIPSPEQIYMLSPTGQAHNTDRRSFSGHQRVLSNSSMHSRQSSTHSIPNEIGNGPIHINTLLQKLANKEQELLDLKQRIEDIKKQLVFEEQSYIQRATELQELKELVTKQLNSSSNNNISEYLQSVDLNTPTNLCPINFSESASSEIPQIQIPKIRNDSNLDTTSQNGKDILKKVGEPKNFIWRRPLSVFNQFDQIIQQEMEKALHWDVSTSPDVLEQPSKIFPPMDYIYDNELSASKQLKKEQSLDGTARSLWSFVSDIRSGLLGIIEDPEEDSQKHENSHIQTQVTDSLNGNTEMRTTPESSPQLSEGIKQFKTGKRRSALNSPSQIQKRVEITGGEAESSDRNTEHSEIKMVEMTSF